MTQSFDSMLRISTLRADHYSIIEDPSDSGAIEPLRTGYLNVDADVHPGRVTLAAGSTDNPRGGHGVEFDLEPAAARQLGEQLLRAAETVATIDHDLRWQPGGRSLLATSPTVPGEVLGAELSKLPGKRRSLSK